MSDLITVGTIREILNRHMKLNQSYSLEEIYSLIQDHYHFSATDLKPYRDASWYKHWEHQVGNVLSRAKTRGQVDHDDSHWSKRSYNRFYTRVRQLD